MIKKFFSYIFCILLLNSPFSFAAETWARGFGGPNNDRAWAATPTNDGGFLIGGRSTDGTANSLVIKLNEAGAITWQQKFQPASIRTVQQTRDGGFILSGRKFIAKLTSSGSHHWMKQYGTNRINGVQQTKDGGYVVVGRTSGPFESQDFWIAKLKSDGSVEWQKNIGGSSFDSAQAVFQSSDGGFVVAGTTLSFFIPSLTPDFLVVKLSPDGKLLWKKLYDFGSSDVFLSMSRTSDGGFVITGRGPAPAFLVKLDANGEVQWSKSYEFIVGLDSIRQIRGGGFVGLFAQDVIKLDQNGDVIARKRFLPPGHRGQSSALESIRPIKDGGFIVAGRAFSSSGSGTDLFVLKLDNDLNATSSCVTQRDLTLDPATRTVSVHSNFKPRVENVFDRVIELQPRIIASTVAEISCP